MKVGDTLVALDRTAALPAGLESDQLIGERVSVGIGAAAAIEGDERPRGDAALVRAGVGDRRDIAGGDDHAVRGAVHGAVAHDELRDIGAGEIDGEGR